jgi:hypothetical protein
MYQSKNIDPGYAKRQDARYFESINNLYGIDGSKITGFDYVTGNPIIREERVIDVTPFE